MILNSKILDGKMMDFGFGMSRILDGLGAGFWLDNIRASSIEQQLLETELNFNDARLQNILYKNLDAGACQSALKANLDFNDKIYSQGAEIEKLEQVNRFAPNVLQEKKRYALLQLQFYLNALELKEKCNFNYTTAVYFYSHYDKTLEQAQNAQSAVLVDLIHQCKDFTVVPLPIDLQISSIDFIKSKYNVSKAPSILVDEEKVLEGLQTKAALKSAVAC